MVRKRRPHGEPRRGGRGRTARPAPTRAPGPAPRVPRRAPFLVALALCALAARAHAASPAHPDTSLVTQLYFEGDKFNKADEFIKPSLIVSSFWAKGRFTTWTTSPRLSSKPIADLTKVAI